MASVGFVIGAGIAMNEENLGLVGGEDIEEGGHNGGVGHGGRGEGGEKNLQGKNRGWGLARGSLGWRLGRSIAIWMAGEEKQFGRKGVEWSRKRKVR
jgi:hypothetical protein